MTSTEELKAAWQEIKDNIQQRHCYPMANVDRHPNPRSVFLVDEFISSLDSTAKASEIKKILP